MTQPMTFPANRLLALLTSLLILAGAVVTASQRADSAEALLRTAIDREVIEGDVLGAIKDYQAIVNRFAKTDRATAVQALMRMADAHQRLGNGEASRIYDEIVRDYAEQKDAVSVARTKLAALRTADVPRGSGPICTSCVGPFFHSFTQSPDGRWLGYTAANNDLMSRNLQTGEVKRLVSFPAESYSSFRFRARRATWSRDSRQVAYLLRDTEAPGPVKDRAQLRVLSVEAPGESRTLVDNPDFIYVFPAAWSLDGRSILVSLQRRDFTWQIAWVSAQTGTVTVLRSLNWDFDEFRNGPDLSPDGRHIVYATFVPVGTSSVSNHGLARSLHIMSADGSRDIVIPAAAIGFTSPVWSADGSRILFVSNRDNSGTYDLWVVDVRDGAPAGLPRLVKASIGANIALVGLTQSGLLYYVQPESSELRIVVADLEAKGSGSVSGPTTGFAGSRVTWSPDGKRLASFKGVRSLTVRSIETGREQMFTLPARLWGGPAWYQDGSAVLVGIRNNQTGRGFAVARLVLDTGEVQTIGTYAPPDDLEWNGQITVAADGRTIFVPATASGSRERSLIALDLASGSMTPVVSGLSGMLRLQQSARGTVGQAVDVMSEPVPTTGVAPRADGKTIALTLMKDAQTYLTTFDTEGSQYRQLYGPLPLRPWTNGVVSRLGDPKWLKDGLGIAFGIQQDDLSWKLMRVTNDGRAEPLAGKGAGEFTLAPGTLGFDISPDGKRVAYERLMTFSDELWALDLTSLLKKPQ